MAPVGSTSAGASSLKEFTMAQTTSLVFNGGVIPSPSPAPSGNGKAKLLKIGEITVTEQEVQVTKKVICDPDSVTTVAPFMEVLTSARLAELISANTILVLDDGTMQYLMSDANIAVEDGTSVCTAVNFLGLSKENRAKVLYPCTRLTDELTLQHVIEVGEPVETGFDLVKAYPEDTEAGTLIDKLEVVDNVRDPEDPEDAPLLSLETTVDGQGNRKVGINEDNLQHGFRSLTNVVSDVIDTLDSMDFDEVPHGSFGSSLNQSPGDGTSTSIQVSIFRPIETTVGDAISWTKTTEIGGEDFGTVTLEPGTYIICSDITCQWVGVPAGTYLPQVGNVLGEPFDFSQQQEVHRRTTNVVTVSTATQFKMRISFDAATPVMGFWINSAQIVKIAGGMSQTNVAHDSTLTGKGSVAEPLGVNNQVVAQNALAGNVASEFVPNNTEAKAGQPYVYGGMLYIAKEDYNGDWDSAKFYQVDIAGVFQSKSGALADSFLYKFCYFNAFDKDDDNVTLSACLNDHGYTVVASSYNTTGYIPVAGGLVYSSNKNMRVTCFYDGNKNYIQGSMIDDNITSFTAPAEACYMRTSTTLSKWTDLMIAPTACLPSAYMAFGKALFRDKSILERTEIVFSEIDDILPISQTNFCYTNIFKYDAIDVTLSACLTDRGDTSATSSYNTSGYIEVIAGETYSSNKNMRVTCFYDKNKSYISASMIDANITSFTAPTGASYVRTSIAKSNWSVFMLAISGNLPPVYFEFGKYQIKSEYLPKNQLPLPFGNYSASNAELAVNSNVSISGLHISKNACIIAKIKGSIEKVSAGVAYLGYYGKWIEIDSEKVTLKYGTEGNTDGTYNHGLTLDDILTVCIDRVMNLQGVTTTTVRLVTQHGQTFNQEVPWGVVVGDVFIRNQNSSATLDCELKFMAKDATKKIWIFGDSYMSYENNSRWPYYIVHQNHFTEFLLDAVGGMNSTQAWTDFSNLLANRAQKPTFAVWGMGMNDGTDTGGTPSSTWLTNVQRFLEACDMFGITPILMTIPSVPDHSLDHSAKTAWVKSSGRRYIDEAAAVEQEGTNTWKFYGETAAFLSSDLVHPTSYGAKAIANQVLIDFPEISVN
jgi:hypothetical protein